MRTDRKMIFSRLCFLILLFTLLFSGALPAQVTAQNQINIDQCKSLEDDNPLKAITFANQILNNLDSNTYPVYYGQITGCLGWALAMSNQKDRSRIQAEILEKLVNTLMGGKDKSTLYMRVGGIFHLLGDRVGAVSNYKKALVVAEKWQLKKELIPILVNLGVINSELKVHKVAIDNYNYALELMLETGDFRYKPPVLFNLALTLNGQKMHQQGLAIFLEIESMIDDNWPKGRVSQVYSGLANSYMGLDDYVNAKTYNDKTMKIHIETGALTDVKIMTEVAQAKILQKLGQHDLAKIYADKAYQYYINLESQSALTYGSNGLSFLASVFNDYGDYEKSVEIYKLSHELYNKFQESFNKENIAQMQARLINSQQTQELVYLKHKSTIEKLKADQQQDKNSRDILIVTVFVVFLLLFLIWLRILNIRLKKMSLRDSLTQLGNRRALNLWLTENPLKNNSQRKLWLLDLDNFKNFNDKYGHDRGDLALIAVSKYLMSLNKPQNFIGRWGGEEFILITDDIRPEGIHTFANKILSNISQLRFGNGNQLLHISASMGITDVDKNPNIAWEVSLKKADNALYEAKDNGRNCYVLSH